MAASWRLCEGAEGLVLLAPESGEERLDTDERRGPPRNPSVPPPMNRQSGSTRPSGSTTSEGHVFSMIRFVKTYARVIV